MLLLRLLVVARVPHALLLIICSACLGLALLLLISKQKKYGRRCGLSMVKTIRSCDVKGYQRRGRAAADQIRWLLLERERIQGEQGGSVRLLFMAKAESSWASMAMTCKGMDMGG